MLKHRLEPRVSSGLEMADELEQTQFPLLLVPHGRPERGTEGIGQQDEQHAPVEITQRAMLGGCREHGQMKMALPRLEHEFDLPA